MRDSPKTCSSSLLSNSPPLRAPYLSGQHVLPACHAGVGLLLSVWEVSRAVPAGLTMSCPRTAGSPFTMRWDMAMMR
jgi:hypothetical protein